MNANFVKSITYLGAAASGPVTYLLTRDLEAAIAGGLLGLGVAGFTELSYKFKEKGNRERDTVWR